jgi:hypothetical protein
MCLRKDTRRARLTLRRIRRAEGALVWRKRASAAWQATSRDMKITPFVMGGAMEAWTKSRVH